MDRFLYDRNVRYERVKYVSVHIFVIFQLVHDTADVPVLLLLQSTQYSIHCSYMWKSFHRSYWHHCHVYTGFLWR